MRLTRHQKTQAGRLLIGWRREGAPTRITAHEAWVLSEGRVGVQGDHSTPHNLATVAAKVAQSV